MRIPSMLYKQSVWSVFLMALGFVVMGSQYDAVPDFQKRENESQIRNGELQGVQAASNEPQVVINEIMSSNGGTITDEDGEFSDWIELYNDGKDTVSLHHWGLTDDVDRRYRWVFPDVELEPGGFLLIWASGKDRRDPDAPLHTGFSISREGEPLVLRDPQGTIVDSLPPVAIPRDMSYGRSPDGSGTLLYFDHPTPGAPNADQGYEQLLQPPEFSAQAGFHADPVELEITAPGDHPDAAILYTLDGSLPDPANMDTVWYAVRNAPDRDKEYRPAVTRTLKGPIAINDRSVDPNDLSLITNTYGRHRDPESVLAKGTTVRAAVYQNGRMGPVATRTYFIGPQFDTCRALPVLSITAEAKDLFGYERGILVPGVEYDYESAGLRGGNYMERGREWEREAHAQYFLPDGQLVLNQNMGVRVHGGTSRHYTHKSLRLYARADYGERYFDFPLFKERGQQRYKRLKLRNSGQDIIHTFFRDGLISNLMLNTHVDLEAFQPVQVFINGEYWGILNMRERFDRYYVQERYGVDEQDVVILDHWTQTDDHYSTFRDYVTETHPDDRDFHERVSSSIDLLSLFDLRIADIYFGRWDIHHWRIWRDGTAGDSRWRWNLWDMDVGLGLPNDWGPPWTHGAPVDANYLEPFLTDFRTDSYNLEFKRILENQQARTLFLNRFADLMNTRFKTDYALSLADAMQAEIEPVMDRHIARWRPPSGIESKESWFDSIDIMRKFISERREHVTGHLSDFFDLEPARITIDRKGGCGTISVNTVELGEYGTSDRSGDSRASGAVNVPGLTDKTGARVNFPWNGVYFQGNEIQLRAEGSGSCAFLGWEVDHQWESAGETLTVDPEPGMEISALFEGDVADEPEVPASTGLLPNYPNPFNDQTVVPFTLASPGRVRLQIFDALGRKVTTPVDTRFEGGFHRINWDAGNLATGVYVIIMETGEERFVQKATILK